MKSRKITGLESLQNSRAFCMKPWVHLFISHFGTVVPCCLTPWDKNQALGDINEQSITDIWNGQAMRELRLKMLNDEQDQRCKQCYENESVGLRSTRNITNLLYSDKLDWALNTQDDGTAPDAKPVYWDIRISNLCNFKCRICGHHSSSQWYEDAKALGLLSHDVKLHRGPKDFDNLLSQLDFVIPDLEEIYFAGGEPLIMEEHYRILEMLLARGKTDITLRYATNFSQTIYKNSDAFKLWAHFEEVYVHASLDGSGRRGEFQRTGQSWDQVVANRKRMLEVCPEVYFVASPTMSVFNILHLPDFHREWVESGFIRVDEFMPHMLKDPVEYNIRILPASLKQQAGEELNRHIDWIIAYAKQHPPRPLSARQTEKLKGRGNWLNAQTLTGNIKSDMVVKEFRNCITFMNSKDESELLPEFRRRCRELDRLRQENTPDAFPELACLFT